MAVWAMAKGGRQVHLMERFDGRIMNNPALCGLIPKHWDRVARDPQPRAKCRKCAALEHAREAPND